MIIYMLRIFSTIHIHTDKIFIYTEDLFKKILNRSLLSIELSVLLRDSLLRCVSIDVILPRLIFLADSVGHRLAVTVSEEGTTLLFNGK